MTEPEWYGMIGIVGRCVEGPQIAHEWSAPYPRYSKDETARKLTHALAAARPLTCSTIRYDKGGDDYCRECQHWDTITSPIVLGMPRPSAQDAHRRRNGQAPDEDMPTEDLQDTRPVIRIGPDITRMVDEGQAALLALPDGPVLFQRARRLSIIARGVNHPGGYTVRLIPRSLSKHKRPTWTSWQPRPRGGRNLISAPSAARSGWR